MNKNELRLALINAGVNPRLYSLDGAEKDECLILEQEPLGKWTVYYSERGDKSSVRHFDSENEACEYILAVLLRDPTTRKFGGARDTA
jgi:hypothetical protein